MEQDQGKFAPSWSRSRSLYIGSPLNVSYAEFFRFMLQFLCLQMCVYGGGAVPQGGVGDRHLVTVPQGVVGDPLPWGGEGQGDGMGVCPTPARHVARPTLCVSGLCHRLPRTGLGATQTTTDPVRDRWVKFPYPHSLGTLVGVTSGASGPHSRTHTHTMSFHGPDRGAWRAPRKAVSGVSAFTRKQWHCRSHTVPQRLRHTGGGAQSET